MEEKVGTVSIGKGGIEGESKEIGEKIRREGDR